MESPPTPPSKTRRRFFPTLILTCVSVLTYISIIQPWSLRQISLSLTEGEVSPQDLRAPHSEQFVSEILTETARLDAERAIAPIYDPPDASIARAQSEKLSEILRTITEVRQDEDDTLDQKKIALLTIPDLSLQPGSQQYLLSLPDPTWEAVRSEAYKILGQSLQNSVRTENLEAVRQKLASMVSLTLTEKENGLVVEIVSPLIVANSFYSPELTEEARQAAREAVRPITRSFVQGQTVLARGQVITEVDLEALTILGLVQPINTGFNYAGAAALVILAAVFTGLYFTRRKPGSLPDLRSLLILAILFIIFLVGARVSNPNRTLVPYLIPVPAFALLAATLFGMENGLVFGLMMSVFVAYGLPDALALLPYYIFSSLVGVLTLGQGRRVIQYVFTAIAIALAGSAVIAAYRLPFTDVDWIGLMTLMGAAVFTGIASTSIALPMQYLLAQFLGLTTAMQLLEISRPDSPLLSYFLQRAPGTYQHSLQVANLAEQAAESIRADALLTRVGALFHDVGKSTNPLFFIENQPASQIDSHDDLPPASSAEIILRHVPDGLDLAKKYHLPRRLHDFISEHHGTLITRYQYNRAVEAAGGDEGKVDKNHFRYPGPAPRSKETAILMLADGVEARARAERPADENAVRLLVRSVVERCQAGGQLDDTPLLQKELGVISESFISTLRATYHPRLEYPKDQPVKEPSIDMTVKPITKPIQVKKGS